MSHRHSATRAIAFVLPLFVTAPAIAGAQRLDTGALLTNGRAVYQALPDRVTLLDAPRFSEALGYLYAYEIRMDRARKPIPESTRAAVDWLVSNVAGLQPGKADDMRTDAGLLQRGMQMQKKAAASEIQGKVWDVGSFIAGSANLFAYLQNAPKPTAEAASAHDWFVQAQARLVRSDIKGDKPSGTEWMPGSRRPRITSAALKTKAQTPKRSTTKKAQARYAKSSTR